MHSLRNVLRDANGYSLIEAMTVLVLVLVIVSLAVPSMGSYVEYQKARRALDLIASDLSYARALAVRAGEPSVVEFRTGGDYLIWVETTPRDTLKRVSLGRDYPGIALTLPTESGRLTFDRRGLVRNIATARIVASLHESADTLSITAAGRVYRAR